MLLLALVVVAALIGGCYVLIKPHLAGTPSAQDYSGVGYGTVRIQVKSGDSADAIGTTLVAKGVVASSRAFTRAALDNPNSQNIQPGFYDLHSHMAAAQALTMLLNPDAKIVVKVSVPEGTIEKDVIAKLATALGVPVSAVQAAAQNVANLGLPDGYTQIGSQDQVSSAEGFLYPDTYNFDPGTTPAAALQQMASEFTSKDREIGFAAGAAKLKITPYAALIIASITESEAKFDSDRPKVARVILNRLAQKKDLQIDASSAYAAKLLGLDPTKVNYANLDSPYNTYKNAGLPPTPLGNPGEAALEAAITPATGNWLFYVNGDAAGHLTFTNDPNVFAKDVTACQKNHWGCD